MKRASERDREEPRYERGNEQTLELLEQRNICRWRSPFQSQHGGMIGASTGSYAYPRICGSFFPHPCSFSSADLLPLQFSALPRFARARAPILAKTSVRSQDISSSLISLFSSASPGLVDRRSCGKRKRSSLIQIQDLAPSRSRCRERICGRATQVLRKRPVIGISE